MSARHQHSEEAFVVRIFLDAALGAFKMRPPVRPWAESLNVIIPSEANRMLAGQPYRFDLFPCMASLVFGFFEDSTREMILMKDTQSGASTHAFWATAWMLAFDPGNVIYISKGRDATKNMGQDRMGHIFDGVPQLKRSKKDGLANSTAMAWRFPGGALFLGGCDSATTLIGQPASRVLLDEIKEHPFIDGKSTMDMARMRIKMDDGGKIFAFSTAGDAVEYSEDQKTGKKTPIATPESTPHLEYLTGTQEQCEVPCPHCGYYQVLDEERLVFRHCKESFPDMPAAWNRTRVLAETWYRCANTDCTDRNDDGTVRGKIEERHKPGMMAAHRWVVTNPHPWPRRRSAGLSALYNIATPEATWGHVALAILDAAEKGTQEALKSLWTDWLGKPWQPRRVTSAQMAKVVQLKRTYRRAEVDGTPRHRIPWPTAETRFVGGLVDVQADHVKWLVQAGAWDGRQAVLDWGMVQFLENVPDVFRQRWWTCQGEKDESLGFPVSIVFTDVSGTQRSRIYRALYEWGVSYPEIAWEGVAGRDKWQTRQVRIASWEKIRYPVKDENHVPLPNQWVHVHNIDADYWETQLYGECIDRFDPKAEAAELVGKGMAPAAAEAAVWDRQRLWLPKDVNESFIRELCNMKQVLKNAGTAGHKEWRWVKSTPGPNDYGDLCKYGQVQIHAVREEGR
jgi:phage terminase large subunit GpA-like protein